MNKYGQLFADELTNWLIDEAGFKHSKCQMSVYDEYAPDGSKFEMCYLMLITVYIGIHLKN